MNTNSAAPQRLYLMQVATIPQRNLPFVCYLVQTDDGTNILIDSGLPSEVQPPPGMPVPVMGKDVLEQLAQLSLIDAVAQQRSFIPEREAGPMDMDQEMLRASTRKLLALAQREQVPLTIFGHDGEQWQTLRKAPDFYS